MGTTTEVRPERKPWRLSTNGRRVVLVSHIASAGAWLGIDVAMAVLIGAAKFTDDLQVRASSLRVLEMVTVWPLLVCGLLCLGSGVLLGLGSKWGLVKHWWVLTKLVLNLLLTTLVVVSLQFEVAEQARRASLILDGQLVPLDLSNLIYPPVVSPAALLFATILSVVKPWGRVRKTR
ncbi:DUF2269 family protein [Labedaea rhizosphaerae]|uniref:DUF2269 domain-containing protein n=1 Tax=Labedaea rhizosphaerae TaxID=598644 RepID=A0A4R6SIX5_LABRH|nr:hypothetical protein [Labedaea rhizosphaerae]TDQ01560.1 hypothetical protein EV186_1021429 [Labedaea rhizosphaerae]